MIPQLLMRTVVLSLLVFTTAASAQELKVDINNNNRPVNEGLDPAYTSWNDVSTWFTSGANSISKTFGTITVTFTRTGGVGTGLEPGYNKANVQSPTLNVKLTADGIKVADGDTGAQIEMRISGLSAGAHTLATYHNSWNNIASLAPLNVFVNGTQVATNVPGSINVTDNLAAGLTYVMFTASAGQDVVVLFAARTSGSEVSKNVYINGFEIDTPNPKRLARNPSPANADEHVNADAKSLTLSWASAYDGTAVSHDIYFGTSSNAVRNATHASPEFKGNQAGTTFGVSSLNSLLTYYWRVDEVASGGAVTRGNLWYFRPRQLAFPGAEGYGRFARGGRGGVVVKVTNLNDSGPGSFRDAIEGNYGPRTVIFDVSGQIILSDDVIIDGTMPPITVAGQTAPGKGICFRRQQFALSGAEDAIVRHVRVRVGKESGETQNGSGMAGVDHCIMDHCSVSWGIDEEISSRGAKNMTLQRTFISEALNIAGHDKYPAGTAHGYAASIGGDVATFHHNLLAHCAGRNWSLAGGLDANGNFAGRLDIFNNVVYNWDGRTTDGGAHEVNFVGNYYKPGPAIGTTTILTAQYENFPGTQRYYYTNNVMPGYHHAGDLTSRTYTGTPQGYSPWVDVPFFPSYATIDEVTNAYKKVLSDVGCNQPMIDDHDARVIRETLDATYTYSGSLSGIPGLPDTTADVGGWENYGNEVRPAHFDTDNDGMPNWWEVIKGFNTNSTPGDFGESNSDLDGDGFTALEDFLNWLAEPHYDCSAGGTVDIDLHALSRGFTNASPSYTFSNLVSGTVTLVSNRFARFTPATSANALGQFFYKVTDNKGYNMTRPVNIRILGGAASTNAPATPTGLNATAGDAQVSLNWNVALEATSYIVKRSTTSGSGYVNILTNATTTFTNTGLANGTTYYYVVSSLNAAGESGNSSQAGATPQVPVPTGLTATAGIGQVSLTWAASAGATNYIVKRSTTSGSGFVNIATNATRTFTNTGLVNGMTYYFAVSALTAGGESANSSQAIATPGTVGTIAIVDPPGAVATGSAATTVTTPVTVSPGANCLVVLINNMKENATGPWTVAWNGQTLANAVCLQSSSTGAKSTIYHLYNPVTDGLPHDLAVTFTAGATAYHIQYFTLSGVNTAMAPLIGSANASGTTQTFTISGCPLNGLAALNAVNSSSSGTTTAITAHGGGTLTVTNITGSSPSCSMGYAQNIAAGTDTFTATASVSGKFAFTAAVFTPGVVAGNNPPVASTNTYPRNAGFSLKIPIAELATNWSDVDNDPLQLIAVNPSTNGVTPTFDALYITYTNANDAADRFTYTISDGNGGTAEGAVNVTIAPPGDGPTFNILGVTPNGDGSMKIKLAGVPGYWYGVQGTTSQPPNLAPPVFWQTLGSNAAGTNGLWEFIDTNSVTYPQGRFYRSFRP